jgi:hypothetical protein
MKRIEENQQSEMTIHCSDCDEDFVFTAGEQQFFKSKGLSLPKRCPICRKARKDSIVSDGTWE